MTELIDCERSKLETAKTMPELHFAQGFIKSLQRVIHYVEVNKDYFEQLHDEKDEISQSPDN